MQVKQGTLVVPGSTGSQAYTGIGFQPKFGFFWGNKNTSSGFNTNRDAFFGFAAGDTTSRVVSHTSGDAQTTATTMGRRQNTVAIELISCSGSIVSPQSVGALSSWDADGFTINWSNVGNAGAVIHYLVVGGSDVTNTWAGTINTPTTTGSQAYTDPGFQPDFLMMMTLGENTTVPGSFTQGRLAIGAASSATAEESLTVHDSDNIPTQVADIMSANILDVENLGSTKFLANLTSFDATGFTLNWTTTQASSSPVFVLAVKGGDFFVGTDTQKTSTGTKAKTGVGFKPAGLLFLGINRTSSGTKSVTESKLSIGGTDGTNQSTIWGESKDAVSTTDCNSYYAADGTLAHASNSATLNAKAAISSLDSDGYTLNWTTADATAREFTFIAFGAGTQTLTGAASLTEALGITTSGTRVVKASVSQSITVGATTTGTRVKTGSASSTFTVGITTAAGSSIAGSASLEVTADFTTAAKRERFASVSSSTTAGIATTGTLSTAGAVATSFTVGIATVATAKIGAAVSVEFLAGIGTRGVRGKSITLDPETVGGITLDPKQKGTLP